MMTRSQSAAAQAEADNANNSNQTQEPPNEDQTRQPRTLLTQPLITLQLTPLRTIQQPYCTKAQISILRDLFLRVFLVLSTPTIHPE